MKDKVAINIKASMYKHTVYYIFKKVCKFNICVIKTSTMIDDDDEFVTFLTIPYFLLKLNSEFLIALCTRLEEFRVPLKQMYLALYLVSICGLISY